MNPLLSSLSTVALLMGATLLMIPLGPAQAATSDPVLFGMGANTIHKEAAAGVAPDLATFWVGPWTLKHGWGGPDGQMSSLRSAGVTPAIHFYYWGDDITPTCIENGCWSSLHSAQKDKAGWQRLAQELVDHMWSKMGGEPVMIFLETEFNKGGASNYEPLDGYLAEKANFFHDNYPNAKIVMALGNWNSAAWGNFDRTAAASDYVGIQGMRGSTRDSEASYDNLYEATLSGANKLKTLFNKPIVIQDVALSSYPEPYYLNKQANELSQFFSGLPALKTAGVEAILYRTWQDNPNMDLANYYGEAERHWGMTQAYSGEYKPAASVWIEGVKAERAGSTPPPPPPSDPLAATFAPASGSNEWWVDVKVEANAALSSVDARVNGGAWNRLASTSWGTWAASFHAPAGSSVVFKATDVSARSVESETFTWLSDGPGPEPEPEPEPEPTPTALKVPAAGAKFEVENFELKTTGGLAKETAASAGAAWNLWANGRAEQEFDAEPGRYDVTVRARGTFASGVGPHMDVAIAGADVLSVNPGSGYADYKTTMQLDGAFTLTTEFTNDLRTSTEDRNLIVDSVTFAPSNGAPVAAFTASKQDLTYAFDASASSDPDGDALSYSWDFGNGAQAQGMKATHTYKVAGTYNVRLTVGDGSSVASKVQTVTPSAPTFTATFSPSPNINAWWVETRVDASSTPARVDVRVDGGGWQELALTSWGAYAKSIHAPAGSTLVFRATDAFGQTAESEPHTWAAPSFSATFTPRSQTNGWWVEVKVDSESTIMKVEAQRNGASWTELDATSWGTYAKSFRVPPGSSVVFRATDATGQTINSDAYAWG